MPNSDSPREGKPLAGQVHTISGNFERFFSTFPLPLAVWDLEGSLKRTNPHFERLTARLSEEAEGHSVFDFVHPDDQATTNAEFQRLLGAGEKTGFECRVRCSDGSYRWLLWSALKVPEEGLIYAAATDVTDQKRAEAAARESEEWLRFTLKAAQVGLCYREGAITTASEHQFHLYGLEPAEAWISREDWLRLIHREDRERVETEQRLASHHGKPYNLEFRVIWPDGSVHWLLCRGQVFRRDGAARKTEITVDITERNRAERVLERAFTIARSPVGILGFDLYIKRANAAWLRLSGRTLEELSECPALEFIHPDDRATVRTEFDKLIASGGTIEFECRTVRRDGSCVWLAVRASVLADEKLIYAMADDITDRKTATLYRDLKDEILEIFNEDASVQHSVQRVVAAVKARTGTDAAGIRLKDGDDFPYFAQESFSEDFLLTENSLVTRDANGEPCRDANGRVCLECACGLVISGKTDPSNPLLTPAGTFWTNDSLTLLELPANKDPRRRPRNRCCRYRSIALAAIRNKGEIIGLMQLNSLAAAFFSPPAIEHIEQLAAHIGEAIARKQAEEAVRRSEQRFRLIAETMDDVFWIWDLRSHALTYVSPAFERVWGRLCEAAYQSPMAFMDGIHPDDRGRVLALVSAQLDDSAPFEYEYRVIRPDGIVAWIWDHGFPVLGDDGKIKYLVGLARDITERKRMEEAARLQTERLARSNMELERFAYVASHDLQEPLRMVASFTQLLGQRYSGRLDSTADRYIDYAVDGAKRMQALITDLLVYSRANSKELDLKPTPCETVVAGALLNLQAAIAESGARVTWDPLPTLLVDPGQMGQLFQNLLGNAIKFRRETTPQVHISVEEQDRNWLLSVRDNGIGIDSRQADRIFQLFQRLHGRTEYSGTGIGLAICKKVVERHGGKIWVESQPGAGSTFRFTLPRAVDNRCAPPDYNTSMCGGGSDRTTEQTSRDPLD